MKFRILEEKNFKKFYKNIEGHPVYLVDGNYIRSNLESEFTNFGQHFRFPNLIPEKEFWIDVERESGEINFYLSHLLVEYNEMANGQSYDKAYDKAAQIEKNQREKKMLRKDDVRVKLFKKLPKSGIKIFIVDGESVRNQYNMDFTEGGHWLVYNFIPKGECWLDNDVEPKERKWILAHELAEIGMMENGLNYETAHAKASKYEQKLRRENEKIINNSEGQG